MYLHFSLQQLCLLVVRAVEKIAVSKEHPSFSSSDQAFEFCLIHENTESTSSGSLLKSCNLAVEVLSELKKCPVQTVSQKVCLMYFPFHLPCPCIDWTLYKVKLNLFVSL